MYLTGLNLLLSCVFPQAEISLLIDIFQHKNINNAVNFYCVTAKTAVCIQKVFYNHHIRISSQSVKNTSKIPISYSKIGIIVNTSCTDLSLLLEHLKAPDFNNPFNWFIFAENLTSAVNLLSQYPIELNSDVTVIHRSDNIHFLYEVYNTGIDTKGRFFVKPIGYWNSTLHIEERKRMDLSGVVLRCTVVITQKVTNETFEEYVERSKLSKSDTLHKLKYYSLLKYLRDMYNFR